MTSMWEINANFPIQNVTGQQSSNKKFVNSEFVAARIVTEIENCQKKLIPILTNFKSW